MILDDKLAVLLIEDNIINQRVIKIILEKNNCQISIATNGLEGYKFFLAAEFDLILMDIQMPLLDGYKATKKIRTFELKHPEKRRTPILGITANIAQNNSQKYLEVGMDNLLPKPFNLDSFKEAISTLA